VFTSKVTGGKEAICVFIEETMETTIQLVTPCGYQGVGELLRRIAPQSFEESELQTHFIFTPEPDYIFEVEICDSGGTGGVAK